MSKKMTRLMLSASIAAMAVTGVTTPVLAQLDRITVTAERREETLQDVSIAVSAFTAEDLDTKQIDEPLDLVNYVPNLIGSNNTGLGSANVYYIRGLGNTESIATFDPPVGTYVDEVYVARQNGNNVSFFDVERIEVLRGPQGTLFGRNTTGGAVSIVMAKPDDEFGGWVEAGYGAYNRFVARATVDVPVTDKVLTKLSGFYIEDEGFVENLVTGDDLNGQDAFGIRGDLRLLLTENITWDISADYIEDESTNIVNTVEGGSVFALAEEAGDRVSNTPFETSDDITGRIEDVLAGEGLGVSNESYSLTSNLEIATGFGTFNIITGLRSLEQKFVIDFFDGFLGGFVIANDGEHDQFSQEVKYAHSFMDGRIDVVAGGFYFSEENTTDFTDFFFGPGADRVLDNDLDSIAIYGQADIALTKALTLTAGARWTQENKEIAFSDNRTGVDPALALETANLRANGIPTEQITALITPRFALEYQVNENFMAFVSATEGFKSGGWNARGAVPNELLAFDREKAWSYEAGVRSEWFDNRLRLNVTGFYLDVTDFQVPSAFVRANGSIAFITQNFADLENKGVEIDLTAEPIEGLNLFAAIGIQDAEYVNPGPAIRDQLQNGPFGQGIVAPGGDLSLPVRSPDFTASFGGSYRFAVPDMPFYVQPSVAVRYAGEHFVGTANQPIGFEDGYWVVNTGAVISSHDDVYQLIVDCTNCTDEIVLNSILAGTTYLNEPRRWNVRARYRF